MVPDDEVQALATRNVVGAVAPRAQVHDARAHFMMIGMSCGTGGPPRRSSHRTSNHTLQSPAEADVESTVAVVRVDVQVAVLVRPVFYDERMC